MTTADHASPAQARPDPIDSSQIAQLAHDWTTLLEATSSTSLSRPEIDRLTIRLASDLVLAVAAVPMLSDEPQPSSPDDAGLRTVGRAVGTALVNARFTSAATVDGTIRLLGERLSGCVPMDTADQDVLVRSRVAHVQGAVASGHADALLEVVLVEQEQIRRADLLARERAEQALRASESRFRSVFTDAAVGIGVGDLTGRILDVNPALIAMLGYRLEEFQERSVIDFMHPEDAQESWADHRDLVEGRRETLRTQKRFFRADGSTIWTDLTVSLIRSDDGRTWHQMAIVEDVTDRRRLQDQLAHEASHDPLTGLPNRTLFLQQLTAALSDTRPGAGVALCFLDLDSFKVINDSLGHLVGDRLLETIAHRLAACLAGSGMVARMGGDEFVALIRWLDDPAPLELLTGQLLEAVAQPIPLEGHQLTVSASIGVAQAPAGQASATDLIRAADITLQRAKLEGKGRVVFHDPQRGATQVTLYTLAATLPGALDRGEFGLRYQPLVDLRQDRLNAVEVLLRWHHPRFGVLTPDRFIELAEETGAILPLGRWILRQACAEAVRLDLPPDLRLSVNIAVRQLQQPGFVRDVLDTLRETGLPPGRLQLEITESAVMAAEAEGPLAALRELVELGVRIAVDDFGTGYSNFAYLRRLPVHDLKLAGAFLDGLGASGPPDPAAVHLVTTMIDLAHGLGISVTAEGVETASQAQLLKALNCDTAQGWYCGPPTTLDAITARLTS
ncbi:MAG: putative bifunctional diguanylate cyclase/phosphodiesterase [Angustibacter sp.]